MSKRGRWGAAAAGEADDETSKEFRRHKSVIEDIFEELVCPITQSLPLDPVTAGDG